MDTAATGIKHKKTQTKTNQKTPQNQNNYNNKPQKKQKSLY